MARTDLGLGRLLRRPHRQQEDPLAQCERPHAGILAAQRRRQDPLEAQLDGARVRVPQSQRPRDSESDVAAPNNDDYYIGGPENVDRTIYPDRESLWNDLIAAYRQEIAALVSAGATYIQYDDTSFPFLCDPVHRDYVKSWGDDPDELVHTYAEKINASLAGRPAGLTVTLHQCRGNREGNWAAEGAYDPVAEVIFNKVDVDGYFLEYDTARAGGFEPLRFLPKGKVDALGVISSKTPVLESADDVLRRIEAASKFAPMEQLALCPQCGFASSVGGNPVTADQQKAKLEHLVHIAQRAWGTI